MSITLEEARRTGGLQRLAGVHRHLLGNRPKSANPRSNRHHL